MKYSCMRRAVSYRTFGSAKGGLAFEVEVGGFLVFFCGGGWTWRIVWQWY